MLGLSLIVLVWLAIVWMVVWAAQHSGISSQAVYDPPGTSEPTYNLGGK